MRIRQSFLLPLLLSALPFAGGCRKPETPASTKSAPPPNILFVTLDTTRVDAVGPEAKGIQTPAFNAIAASGRRFRYAYATVPQTLPSHTSMMTGLYPAGHGVHENGRAISGSAPLLAERLRAAGYHTAAFVSAFALARRFGIARGFETYDDDFGNGRSERTATETTDRVLQWLAHPPAGGPLFLWVHYYDPHYPYTPPEPFLSRYAKKPYLGEVASMDQQLGRLVQAVEHASGTPLAIVIAGDHGEGLGEHGEAQHGNLLYQATMHVPLLLAGPGIVKGTTDATVSTRRVYQTILDWAGLDATNSLRRSDAEVVLGEAMKPFLDYGWQPQVMAVEGQLKTILAGGTEVYDVVADPGETLDLAASAEISRETRATLRDYPIPAGAQAAPAALDGESRKKLASLGYVASRVKPVIRPDAPRPADMASLFPLLDEAAARFVREEYVRDIPLLEAILARDPHNLDSALRLATAYSSLGRDAEAVAAFQRAEAIAPDSQDVRTYLALHYAHGKDWQKAIPMLERITTESPDRLPALEALALVRERQGRIAEALALRRRMYTMRTASPSELAHLAEMAMSLGQTDAAIGALEQMRSLQGPKFSNDLELGVLYLAGQRLAEARDALDRVPPSHPNVAMALFKRAQVSVLLREADAGARIEAARRGASPISRELIARERLFR
ncbi:MAG: sulfatase-like hydrolase/transferase [Acidobacteriota bacterium]